MKSIILTSVLFLAIGTTYARNSNDPVENNPASAHTTKKSTAVVRNILSDKLPSRLLRSVKMNYKDYWITELYKEVSNGKTSYHMTLENADQKVKLIANPPTKWVVKQTVIKDTEAL
ncbi:MAG: hypothetical protein P4L51_13535 [Puia sp.]|nr:hypothetical protein [Puia sp.]